MKRQRTTSKPVPVEQSVAVRKTTPAPTSCYLRNGVPQWLLAAFTLGGILIILWALLIEGVWLYRRTGPVTARDVLWGPFQPIAPASELVARVLPVNPVILSTLLIELLASLRVIGRNHYAWIIYSALYGLAVAQGLPK